jgi:hypothetical protein
MKYCALLLAFAVASQAIQNLPTERRVSYDYKGYTLSGIPLVSNERTGLAIWGKLNLEYKRMENNGQKVVMELESPVIRHVDMDLPEEVLGVSRVPDLRDIITSEMYKQLPVEIEDTLIRHLRVPVSYTLDLTHMTVSDVMCSPDEPEWIVNIKKSIISHFIIPVFDKEMTHVEHTVLGECKVNYDLTKEKTGEQIITKEFNLENCLRPENFTDLIGSKMIPMENTKFVHASVFTKAVTTFNSQKFLVKELVSEGRYSLAPFSPEQGEMTTYTRQEFYLLKEDNESIKLGQYNWVKRGKNLSPVINHDEKTMSDIYLEVVTEEEKLFMITNLLKKMYNEIESTIKPTFEVESTHDFMHATKLMRSLREASSFRAIIQFIEAPENYKFRPMTINALSFCGSPALIEALPMVKELLKTHEFNMIITSLPMTHVPSEDTIKTLKALYKICDNEYTSRQILLTVGSMTHDFCKVHKTGEIIPKGFCREQFKYEMTEFFTEEFLKATEDEKLIVIKAIGNSGLPMNHFLSQLVHTTELRTELRVNAIYALWRMEDHEDMKKTLLPVYRNEKDMFNVEMRIAAFQVLCERIPTRDMLTTLVGDLNEMKDHQLGNYVYSHLKNLIEMPTFYSPSVELSVAAQTLLPTIRRFEDDMWYSKNTRYIIASVTRRLGFVLRSSKIHDHTQALPVNGYLNIAQAVSGYYVNLLETGFRVEGLDHVVKDFILNWAKTQQMPENVFSGKFRKEIDQLQSLLTDEYVPKTLDETKGYIFFKHLGNEIGVFTVKDMQTWDIKKYMEETLYSWESRVNYFTVMPFVHATIKINTPFGVPMVADWSSVAVFSLHSEKVDQINDQDTLIHRHITPRFMVRGLARIGVDMGLYKATVGQCMHLKTMTPITVIVKACENGECTVEIAVNPESHLYKNGQPENLRLIDVATTPCKHVEYLNKKDLTIKVKAEKMRMSPLLLNNEVEYETEDLKFTFAKNMDSWTMQKPLFPYNGHLAYKVDFLRRPKPFGIRFDLKKTFEDKHYKAGLKVTVNPRVSELKMETEMNVHLNLDFDRKTPLFTFEFTPETTGRTFRFFTNFELVKGEYRRMFNWVEAGEDSQIVEFLTKMKFGWDITHEDNKHDIVIKTVLKKSDLQRLFETEELRLTEHPCTKCEKDIMHGVYTTINCMECLPHRVLFTQIDSEWFFNYEKVESFMWRMMPRLSGFLYPRVNKIERVNPKDATVYPGFNLDNRVRRESSIHGSPKEAAFVREHMAHIMKSEDIFSFRYIKDIHPYFTTFNVTLLMEDYEYTMTDLPLIPAFRRMYNLPESRLTETVYERFPMKLRGECVLDSKNLMKTFDGVVYNLTKRVECEQLLTKDITTDNKFEITTKYTTDMRRIVKVVLADSIIEIEQTSSGDKYILKVNKVHKPWDMSKDGEYKVIDTPTLHSRLFPVKTPRGEDYLLDLDFKPLRVTISLLKDMLKIKVPYWHKAGLAGLCGDFDGERYHEFVMPDRSLAPSFERFFQAYTSPVCRAL